MGLFFSGRGVGAVVFSSWGSVHVQASCLKVTWTLRVTNVFLRACHRFTCPRAYPTRRRSCAVQWSRRRRRSTSLSSGSPCESLSRSHSWRWSDCSPDRPSERVHPGQPWLPVGHTTVRITSPGEEQLLLALSTHTLPPSLSRSLYPARPPLC